MKKLLVIALFLMIPSPSYATTGNELLPRCEQAIRNFNHDTSGNVSEVTARVVDGAYCLGYVSAIVDSNNYNLKSPIRLICFPQTITYEQYVRVVVKYLKEHAEKLHQNADTLVFDAFVQAFPCK